MRAVLAIFCEHAAAKGMHGGKGAYPAATSMKGENAIDEDEDAVSGRDGAGGVHQSV